MPRKARNLRPSSGKQCKICKALYRIIWVTFPASMAAHRLSRFVTFSLCPPLNDLEGSWTKKLLWTLRNHSGGEIVSEKSEQDLDWRFSRALALMSPVNCRHISMISTLMTSMKGRYAVEMVVVGGLYSRSQPGWPLLPSSRLTIWMTFTTPILNLSLNSKTIQHAKGLLLPKRVNCIKDLLSIQ